MLTFERNLLYALNMIFDSLLLFLIFALFFKGSTWQDLGLFILSTLAVVALSAVFFNLKPNLIRLNLVISFVLAAGLFWMLCSSAALSLLLGLIIAWRTTVNWEDPLKPDTEAIITISALFAGGLSLFQNEGYGVLFGAVFIQFIFMLGMKIFLHYLKNKTSRDKVRQDFYPVLVIAGLGLIMLVVMGPLKAVILWFFDGILFVLYYVLAIPLWKFFSLFSGTVQYLLRLLKKEDIKSKLGDSAPTDDLLKQKWNKNLFDHDYSPLIWSLAAVLILLIAIYIWKKGLFKQLKPDALLAGTVTSLNSSDLDDSFFINRRWLHAKDRTRKRFSQFEKTMFKHGFPRLPGESAPVWFERLKLSGSEAETVLNSYEKVRYGDHSLSNEEFIAYSKALKKLEKIEHLQKKKSK
ncbi:hypothetical protein [Fictibacillus barbaricus]|uniref:DUF4129 domain-containing protein n=1 Tax=Fictibacillus barbaricus TaxID=182136 RepID=A0ABU1TVP5_9BACL|nr:hypothetical protein [Fictibacillus barbaricus]MDR7071276.1 hypothetical protein [Fictibacillus barbaricus]